MRMIDLHCDTLLKILEDKVRHGRHSELRQNDFAVDIEKLKKADAMAQFFAMYIDLQWKNDPMEVGLEVTDMFYREIEKNSADIAIARNYDELMANKAQGKISAFLTIEEGGVIKGKLHNLRNFYRLGVRLMTLTWNFPNEIGFSSRPEEHQVKGLTPFGEEVVHEMNELGMVIDVSHLSDQGFRDVARLSKKPFVASHSNARAVCNHPRNLTDDMIKILAEKGGVTGMNYFSPFLRKETEFAKVEYIVQHIKHIKNVGGIDVVALGSDYDGFNHPCEMGDISETDKLADALRKNGFSEEEIDKIFYKNALRVIKEAMK